MKTSKIKGWKNYCQSRQFVKWVSCSSRSWIDVSATYNRRLHNSFSVLCGQQFGYRKCMALYHKSKERYHEYPFSVFSMFSVFFKLTSQIFLSSSTHRKSSLISSSIGYICANILATFTWSCLHLTVMSLSFT